MVRLVVGLALMVAMTAEAHPRLRNLGNAKLLTITSVGMGRGPADIQRLVDDGYDIAGIDYEKGTVDVLTDGNADELGLRFLGFDVRATKTVDVTLAPDPSYKTFAEVEELARGYAAGHPGLVRIESIGKSVQNRDIWAIKISDNPDQRELDEPRILFNAMHHAREVMSTEVALDIVDYLVTRYGSDPQVTRWVEGNEIWVVPMLNVDGSNKVWTSDSMWRKNVKNGHGVDINRNYPYAWGACNGSSGSTSSDTYRGPSAGSEPETQALMSLVARVQPVFDISFHSYSELVLYPYGCDGRRSETSEVVEKIGREMARVLRRDSGNGSYTPGTSWETLYAVDGGDIDWMYDAHNVIPYVIEVSSSSQGFQPPYRWRQPTVERVRAGWQLLFTRLEQSGVRGVVTDDAGRALPQTMVTVQSMAPSSKALPVTWRVKTDGTYHLVLNPGMYRLKFELGERSSIKEVTVGAERVEIDVEL